MTVPIVFMTQQDAQKFVSRPRRTDPSPGDLSGMRQLLAYESPDVIVTKLETCGFKVKDRRGWIAVIVPPPTKLDTALRGVSAHLAEQSIETFDTTPPWVGGIRPSHPRDAG